MKVFLRLVYAVAAVIVLLIAATGLAAIGASYYVKPSMPAVETLRDVQLQVPLRVYTRDDRLLAEYGEQRRIPLNWEDIPERIVQAFLAAEDDRFFQHPGVDYQGLLRAAASMAMTGERRQGGGTITMQLARNFFLTREKTISRKVREIFLALRIEHELNKQEILTLYLNKIFLGQRAYGVGAAAEVYFGKTVRDLSLAETATIAGLPKAPSSDNPVRNPERATQRRSYVLRRMLETRYIETPAYDAAMAEPMISHLHSATIEAHAPYVGEMVRRAMLERFGGDIYTAGYSVVTTVDSRLQAAAVSALRATLLEYDRRHGYRGPVDQVLLPAADDGSAADGSAYEDALTELVSGYGSVAGLFVGVVTQADEASAQVFVPIPGDVRLDLDSVAWARRFIDDNARGPKPTAVSDVVTPGDVIIVWQSADEEAGWRLGQIPAVQGAFVALDPMDAAIAALSGGFDFQASKFNRATQARRQPGSSFKPFVYSAALENGFTTASVINDAPVVFDDANLEGTWRPENYSKKFYGPTRLREALVRSRNLVSIRVLRGMGVSAAIDHIQRFGIPADIMPRNLSLALGSVSLPPIEIANAYATIANGGYDVESYVIDRVFDAAGNIILEADPPIACAVCEDEADEAAREAADEALQALAGVTDSATPPVETIPDVEIPRAPAVVSRQNTWLVADMMRDVVRRGTGVRAWRELGRKDLSGKTGTTNDRRDAWFSGFNADLVATAWVGFDQERPLGAREEGSRTALPMWIEFMRVALAGVPNHVLPQPPGLVTVRISPESGSLASAGEYGAIFETFRVGHVPELAQDTTDSPFEQDEEEEEILF